MDTRPRRRQTIRRATPPLRRLGPDRAATLRTPIAAPAGTMEPCLLPPTTPSSSYERSRSGLYQSLRESREFWQYHRDRDGRFGERWTARIANRSGSASSNRSRGLSQLSRRRRRCPKRRALPPRRWDCPLRPRIASGAGSASGAEFRSGLRASASHHGGQRPCVPASARGRPIRVACRRNEVGACGRLPAEEFAGGIALAWLRG